MKKIYFLSALFFAAVSSQAQVLESDNYNSYILGNVGTDTTGALPGQGNMYTKWGLNEDFQIVSIDPSHGKSLEINSGSEEPGINNRTVKKKGLKEAWIARNPINNIVKVTFDLYTGTTTGMNGTGSILAGPVTNILALYYDNVSQKIAGYATRYVGNGWINIFNSASTFPPNTWVSLGYTYDQSNGNITFSVNGVVAAFNAYVDTNVNPTAHLFYTYHVEGNNASTPFAFDNLNIQAVESILATNENDRLNDRNLIIYPNPVKDILHFNLAKNITIKSTEIFDMTGKKVGDLNSKNSTDINVANYPKATYNLKVTDQNNKIYTQKFIKN